MLVAVTLALVPMLFPPQRAAAQLSLPDAGASMGFTLTAMDGAAVTIDTYRGKWLLVYFGYTFCPDICPTTLNAAADALRALDVRAASVQPIFVTIDPRSDTGTVLANYVKAFDPRILGLTGTPAQIAAAARTFHVFYERDDESGEGGDTYLFNHSSFVYLVDPNGHFVQALSGDSGGGPIAAAVTAAMAGKR
jgi:protein SCO1